MIEDTLKELDFTKTGQVVRKINANKSQVCSSSSIEYKPCPFCGSVEIENVREGTYIQSCIIRCLNCGCTLETNEVGYGEQWNKRAVI